MGVIKGRETMIKSWSDRNLVLFSRSLGSPGADFWLEAYILKVDYTYLWIAYFYEGTV